MLDRHIVRATTAVGGNIKRVNSGISRKHKSSIDIYKRMIHDWISNLEYEDKLHYLKNYISPKREFISTHELNANVDYFLHTTSSKTKKTDFIRLALHPSETEPRYEKGIMAIPTGDGGGSDKIEITYRVTSSRDVIVFMDIIPLINEIRVYGFGNYLSSFPDYRNYRGFLRSLKDLSLEINDVIFIDYDISDTGRTRRLKVF